jgi:glycosyltransferase involved in cell wall biosynthesis
MDSPTMAPPLGAPHAPDRASTVRDRSSCPTRRLRIAFLVNNLAYGGAERQLVVLARSLRDRGHIVSVLTLYPGGGLEQELRAAGVRLRSIEKRGRWDVASFFIRLQRAVREESPDILHGYLATPNIATTLIRPLFPGMKTVWGERASDVDLSRYHWVARLTDVITTALCRFPDLHIANSWAGLDHAISRGYPAAKSAVIPNGIDTDRFTPDPAAGRHLRHTWKVADDAVLIGRVGRLDVMKDHATFLRAAAQIARQHDDVRFVCIGNGDARYGEAMRALSCDIGLADRLLWLPAQADMNAVYNALDIVCSSSAFGEGFPNVVGEAMACGALCVVTDVGDSAMLVGDERFVVPPRDPVRLASRIEYLLSVSTTERNDIRAHLRHRVVEHFSVARLTDATETALLALFDGPER